MTVKIRLALAGSAAVLAVAILVQLVARDSRVGSAASPVVELQAADSERAGVELVSPAADPATDPAADPTTAGSARRTPVEHRPDGASAAPGTNVLRVVLEGISAEDARTATVSLAGMDERDGWPVEIGRSWPCPGLTSELDLDPVLVGLERNENLRDDALLVAVDHPDYVSERTRVALDRGVELADGRTVHEVRVRLVRPDFWTELTLAVRDAHTRAHLDDVELRVVQGPFNALWGRNETSTWLGSGLSSPIALRGGRDADEPRVRVAGLALTPAAGEPLRLVDLVHRLPPERGVIVSARAPGHAWGSTSLDVSQGERELLLEPAAALDVRLSNVQLERYAALGTVAMLCVYRIREDGGNQSVRFERLDEALETEGLRLDSLEPGGYRVAVELGGGSWTEQPVLAREELAGLLALAPGETRELLLELADPPAPPERATLAGVVSLPAPAAEWRDEKLRLQLFFQPTQKWKTPDVELVLADLPRVGGALPMSSRAGSALPMDSRAGGALRGWSFRVEDLPVGTYRVQLLPFLEVRIVELPAGGREDVELVIGELAEVIVETVDGRTGERVPLDELDYRKPEPVPGQLQNEWARADTVEPGRFRLWAAPGAMRVWPRNPGRLGYGLAWKDLELVAGPQSVRFELAPVYAMHLEFREGGTALPTGPQGMLAGRDVRAVGHEGRVTGDGLQTNMRVEVSAPGLYELRFEGVTEGRYLPIPPRLVDVRAGAPTEVIVELSREQDARR